MTKKLNIGLFGYGVVGHGVYEILHKNKGIGDITKICVKDQKKRRDLPMEHFTFDKNDLLDNPDINLIVEVISDAEAAFEIVSAALKKGKNVVTANKKMVAEHLDELIHLQKKYHSSLLYEASSCGSIPIIRNLEEYYDNELLYAVRGIYSSSCNYLLTRIFKDNVDYDIAFKQAQDLGFVERDSHLDLVGLDALYKLIILTAHANGVFVKPDEVLHHGILNLNSFDVKFAKEKGFQIKLVAHSNKVGSDQIALFVLPQFIAPDSLLYDVNYENNAVVVEANFSDKQFFMGKGAGGHPTGSAIISDISANRYDYRYEYKKYLHGTKLTFTNNIEIEVYLRYFDEKTLNFFKFEKISEKYYGRECNYVIGTIRMENLLSIKDKLNSSDVQLILTGKLKKV